MSNNVLRARMVETWCMSVMTIGALSVVLGAALSIPNAELLLGACVVPHSSCSSCGAMLRQSR